MSSSKPVKKENKLDLSKLSAKELLLIGESSTFSQETEFGGNNHGLENDDDGDDEENEVMTDESGEEDNQSDQSSEDWEEVDDQHVETQLAKYGVGGGESSGGGGSQNDTQQTSSIPEGGLEIVIPREGVFRKGKKQITVEDILRREMNKERMELQEYLHQSSLVCQLARGLLFNKTINSPLVRAAIEERIKGQRITAKRVDLSQLEKHIKWFRFHMLISKPSVVTNLELTRQSLSEEEFLIYQIMEKTTVSPDYNAMIFVAFLRSLKVEVRLVISLNPLPIRPPFNELCRKPREEKETKVEDTKTKESKEKTKDTKKSKAAKSTKKVNTKKTPQKAAARNTGRRMISSSESEEDDVVDKKPSTATEIPKIGQDIWVEVYLVEEERWVSVDIFGGKVICDKQLEVDATKPITYVVAFDNNNRVKDVTRRYASDWLVGTPKLRIKSGWWDKTLKPFRAKRTVRDEEEDQYLDEHLLSLPKPKNMSELVNEQFETWHPLYVLRRHLLKYEALYPENPPTLGHINKEPIYSRDNVYTLHTRELWMREAKVVRIGEKPYKIVKARPKYDKLSGARLPEAPSELFGAWQTEDYIPPIAQNGKVPRNEWGNVELFTEKLLPQGCVHLRLPGLQRVAKKLEIDCAPAVVGFDFGCGGSRPAFDGFVVCEEFEETLLDAWNQEQDEKKKKDEEKRLQRIYGNWRRLIKGVLIRDRLEKKYSVNLSGKRKANDGAHSTGHVPSSSKKSKKT